MALSPREEDVETEDVLCAAVMPGGGCVVRARDERRGDMGMGSTLCAEKQVCVATGRDDALRGV